MADVLLGLGSNVGDCESHLRDALEALAAIWTPTATSSLWRTEPVGYADQGWFLNLCARGRTTLSPEALLREIEKIEAAHERERTLPNGPRTLDIDILLYDDLALRTEHLTIPHPRMHERRFVLAPAAEIAGEMRHPTLDRDIAALLQGLKDAEAVERFDAGGTFP